MIVASEAASKAAESAVKALKELKESHESDEKSWYRLLPEPSSWWRDWVWSLEQRLGSLDAEYPVEIDNIRKNLSHAQDLTVMTESERKSVFLYGLLASLLKHRPLLVLKQVSGCNGYEALRQLMESCEPVSRNRAMGLLNAMLAWPQFNTKTSFLAQILKLETAFAEYNKTGSTISEEIKSAVLLGSVTGTLKTWLQLRVTDATSYQELRDSILSFERSTTKWSDAMVLGSDLAASSSEAVPMEVDSVTGKGVKGKTKGKDGKGGKTGDGKNQPQWFDYKGGKGKGKGNNNAWSSGGTGSGSWTSPEKGKGKNKGKGKTDGKNKGAKRKGQVLDLWWKPLRERLLVQE